MGNIDQVAVYIEYHSKGTWGMRDYHTRRAVGSAGKEKDRFTDQLTVFKDGTKVRGFFFQSSCCRTYFHSSLLYLNI